MLSHPHRESCYVGIKLESSKDPVLFNIRVIIEWLFPKMNDVWMRGMMDVGREDFTLLMDISNMVIQ